MAGDTESLDAVVIRLLTVSLPAGLQVLGGRASVTGVSPTLLCNESGEGGGRPGRRGLPLSAAPSAGAHWKHPFQRR